jgi:hypothetical protein
MRLKIYLLFMLLLGMGIFAIAQKQPSKEKPTVENGRDAIPVTVTSTKKAKKKADPKKIETTKKEPSKSVKEKTPPTPLPKKN